MKNHEISWKIQGWLTTPLKRPRQVGLRCAPWSQSEGTLENHHLEWVNPWFMVIYPWKFTVATSSTGFFKKNSHPQETTEIPCLPPQPPTSMLWSKVPSIINRNGCFFWRPPNTKFRRQHWSGGRGGHDLCGVVLHGMAVFSEEPGKSTTFGNSKSLQRPSDYVSQGDTPASFLRARSVAIGSVL